MDARIYALLATSIVLRLTAVRVRVDNARMRGWMVFGALMCVAGCGRNVTLMAPHTTGGPPYWCDARGCKPSEVISDAITNKARTTHIVLPVQCHGRFHSITVLESHSKSPELYVTCAPSEDGPGVMGAGGQAEEPVDEMGPLEPTGAPASTTDTVHDAPPPEARPLEAQPLE